MTREEILKGLEICANNPECNGCPYLKNTHGEFCQKELLHDVLRMWMEDNKLE